MYGFIYLCVCLYVLLIPSLCIYIYTETVRERKREINMYTYI